MGINTGPGNLDLDLIQGSWTGFFNGVRAAFPLAVLLLWFFHILLRKQRAIRSFTWPEALWLYYGIVSVIASVYAHPWFDYAYWGFAFLSAFAATEIYMSESSTPEGAGDLNRLNWVLGALVLASVVWVARGQLLEQTSMGMSGYGVLNRIPIVGGMPMVRASGISRLAAIPAIVAFVLCWNTHGVFRIWWAAIFIPAAYLVWVMQSRGSLVSSAVALGFVMILMEGKQRWIVILISLVAAIVLLAGFVSDSTLHYLWLYSTRGTQGQQLASMSGRTRIFDEAWQLIKAAPFIGYGPQADRRVLTLVRNAQNGVLYALLCGGFLGGAGFIGGLALSWVLLIRAFRRRHLMTKSERTTLLQVAGVLVFMTMRSYPENCSAVFSVDLLVQLPAMAYLGELDRSLSRRRGAFVHRFPVTDDSNISAVPVAQVR
ncbi:MAG TPA: O-antigen ligase family protein [Candidatus Binataceae bacterium]|nr:O-antigen ligase family protein [Candidatus Binataceae bacterium]